MFGSTLRTEQHYCTEACSAKEEGKGQTKCSREKKQSRGLPETHGLPAALYGG